MVHATDAPDAAGDELIDPAIVLAETWVRDAHAATGRRQRKRDAQLHALMEDEASLRFAMAFLDRVVRAPSNRVAAAQLAHLVDRRGAPAFLPRHDRVMLLGAARIARRLPGIVMPLARTRLRAMTAHLIVDADDTTLTRHLDRRRREGMAVNVNRLGEAILGEAEATRRHRELIALLERPDVGYVSVKISAITSRVDLWDFDGTRDRICERLREVYRTAQRTGGFVNLDMEEYRDLDLTIAAFRTVLDEDPFVGLDAGIVLQAYLPDSYQRLRELVAWSNERHTRGGGSIKVRIVKGANLAMERVEAEVHGWAQAPYESKPEVDANWKRMIDWACTPARLTGVRLGVASHNLLDVAWAHLLAERRSVGHSIDFEMLEGMAPRQADVVCSTTGNMLLYTPIVADRDFPSAVAYLFRRLEENAVPENFLRHLFGIELGSTEWHDQRRSFEHAARTRWTVAEAPRRGQNRMLEQPLFDPTEPFVNTPDSDPSLGHNREWMRRELSDWGAPQPLTRVANMTDIDAVVARAHEAWFRWRTTDVLERSRRLERLAELIAASRGHIVSTMAHDAGKVVGEGDAEVSEAIDFARWYGRSAVELAALDGVGHDSVGVAVVASPWNFPFAIPVGGVCAALAAGNAVVLKPAPQTLLTAAHIRDCCQAADLPPALVQVIDCPENDVGRRLITHPDVGVVILTGSWDTARLFTGWRPDLGLVAETSGKNAMVITARADLDAAVADLVQSAFGHSGQKCSAASLAIVEAELYDSKAFHRQLEDATRSLVLGEPAALGCDIGPLIESPGAALERGLRELDPGESWLVEPEPIGGNGAAWRPGVRLGVRPGSWFHKTECFGPVLGVMRARNLDQAVEWQNAVAYGLTGGLWTLDPDQQSHWLERVEVGNAYINRPTTGAVVGRQPFGGWKRSVVGPGAKAGGPNYVAQLGTWRDEGDIEHRQDPSPAVFDALDHARRWVEPAVWEWLASAAASDAYWLANHFTVPHDPAGLRAESNVFRYQPLPSLTIRIGHSTALHGLIRVVLGALAAGVPVEVSLDPTVDLDLTWLGVDLRPEFEEALGQALSPDMVRVRVLEPPSDQLRQAAFQLSVYVDGHVPVGNGRVELLSVHREQSVSVTRHRYGNLVGGP